MHFSRTSLLLTFYKVVQYVSGERKREREKKEERDAIRAKVDHFRVLRVELPEIR